MKVFLGKHTLQIVSEFHLVARGTLKQFPQFCRI